MNPSPNHASSLLSLSLHTPSLQQVYDDDVVLHFTDGGNRYAHAHAHSPTQSHSPTSLTLTRTLTITTTLTITPTRTLTPTLTSTLTTTLTLTPTPHNSSTLPAPCTDSSPAWPDSGPDQGTQRVAPHTTTASPHLRYYYVYDIFQSIFQSISSLYLV